MKKFLFVISFTILFSAHLTAQTESPNIREDTFFTKFTGFYNYMACNREEADSYYFKEKQFNTQRYLKTIYSLKTDQKMVEYLCYDVKHEDKAIQMSFIKDIKIGKYEEWYLSGEKKMSCSFKEDKLDGDFTVFYTDKVVKRQEKWKEDKLIEGTCFDAQGQEMTYFPYWENPKYEGGITALYEYLGSTLIYPKFCRRRGIEGTVYIDFVVEKDGSITDIKVKKSVEEHIDKEAMRSVAAMPKWKAGVFDGKPIRVAYTLPIKFKLE